MSCVFFHFLSLPYLSTNKCFVRNILIRLSIFPFTSTPFTMFCILEICYYLSPHILLKIIVFKSRLFQIFYFVTFRLTFNHLIVWKMIDIYLIQISFLIGTRKIAALRAAFSGSCGGLQPSAASVGPFGPNNRDLQAYLKMLKIPFGKCWGNPFGKFCRNLG